MSISRLNSKISATSSADRPVRLPAPSFDLAATLSSGQVFHWSELERTWWGALGDAVVWARQDGDHVVCAARHADALGRFLALDHDIAAILGKISGRDPVMRRAIAYAPGLRILRQPTWECLGTFLTSPMKQVAHIRSISLTLRERFGRETGALPDGTPVFAYPVPEALSRAGESGLRGCALGYRAKSLAATAALVADGTVDLESWHALPTPDLRARLMELPGVGPKIADCVLLFAYGRLDAFPVDVWIARAVRDGYFRGEEVPESRMIAFAARRFGAYAGYAQQFLFHHARMNGPRTPRAP